MILRPRQVKFVERCQAALQARGNTLGVAPTGAGKTVMLSALAGLYRSPLVLQHRGELVEQNRRTFRAVNRDIQTDVITADRKRQVRDGATFAMVQTLCRAKNLEALHPCDLLVIDEAHHVAAESYRNIIDRVLELNPQTKIFGVTATPQRGDKKALRVVFSNSADTIHLAELIAGGFLVPPRCFVIDCGLKDELKQVRKTLNDFDMGEVESIMDKKLVNEKVFEEWLKIAGHLPTVLFCSTVEHALHVMQTFRANGTVCEIVTGETPSAERAETLAAFDRGEVRCLFNVAVLTEGWDCQPAACCVLLRPCSYKSTMLQMIGRVLRRVDPERYPGIIKDEAIVLDFGYSLHTHGDLTMEVDLDTDPGSGEAPMKTCPECKAEIYASQMTCPFCGYVFERMGEDEVEELKEFRLTEVDILNMSPYKWEQLWPSVSVANGMDAWASVVQCGGRFHALGAVEAERGRIHLLSNSAANVEALSAADDYLRQHGDTSVAKKTKSWLRLPMSDGQIRVLGLDPSHAFGINRYRASCLVTWKFNERFIKAKLLN